MREVEAFSECNLPRLMRRVGPFELSGKCGGGKWQVRRWGVASVEVGSGKCGAGEWQVWRWGVASGKRGNMEWQVQS